MAPSRRFYLVPINSIQADPTASSSSHGYSQTDIDRWMQTVPQIQRLRDAGWQEEDFDKLRTAQDPCQRELGDTERHLFRDEDTCMKGAYDGRSVTLENGQHRLESARRQGITAVPVRVWAESEEAHRRLAQQVRSLERADADRNHDERLRGR